MCRMCGIEEETLKHIIEECTYTRIEGVSWKKAINGKKSSYKYLNNILWKRKKKNEEDEMVNTVQSNMRKDI